MENNLIIKEPNTNQLSFAQFLPTAQMHQSHIFLGDQVVSSLFNMQNIKSGVFYNIGYDQLTVSFEEDQNDFSASQIQQLDDYDRLVYDAICTLFGVLTEELEAARIRKRKEEERKGTPDEIIEKITSAVEFRYPMFTPKQVYHIMTSDNSEVHPKPETLEKIDESINKLSKIKINLKTDGSSSKKDRPFPLLNLDTHEKEILLPDSKTQKKEKKVIVTYYVLLKVPVLYDYATSKQMLSIVPSEKIRIASLTMTKTNIRLGAKLRNLILNSSSKDVIFTVEQIFEHFSDTLNDITENKSNIKYRKKVIRNNIPIILDDWKENGFIKDWEVLSTERGNASIYKITTLADYSYESYIEQFNMLGKITPSLS